MDKKKIVRIFILHEMHNMNKLIDFVYVRPSVRISSVKVQNGF